jgi:hypothetical protein
MTYSAITEKPEAYLVSAAEKAGLKLSREGRVDLVSLGKAGGTIKSGQQALCFRSVVALKSQLHSYETLYTDMWAQTEWYASLIEVAADDKLESDLERLHALTSFLRFHGEHYSVKDDAIVTKLLALMEHFTLCFSMDIKSTFCPIGSQRFSATVFQEMTGRVKLCHAQHLLSTSDCDFDSVKMICDDLTGCGQNTSSSLRALAYYYHGLSHMVPARKRGVLKMIWEEAECLFDKDVQAARRSFEFGLMIVDATSLPLKRDLCRSLALVLGPRDRSVIRNWSADALLHLSIGMTSSAKFRRNLQSRSKENATYLEQVFDAQNDDALNLRRPLYLALGTWLPLLSPQQASCL